MGFKADLLAKIRGYKTVEQLEGGASLTAKTSR